MSVFGSIMGAIFGHAAHATAPATTTTPTEVAPADPSGPTASSTATATTATATAAAPAPGPTVLAPVDVAAVLEKAVAASGEKLDWRTSIVDLMKALKLDSSLAARKQLAAELNYPGDTGDSAAMNVWLHRQVMAKLAANGGKLPADIKA